MAIRRLQHQRHQRHTDQDTLATQAMRLDAAEGNERSLRASKHPHRLQIAAAVLATEAENDTGSTAIPCKVTSIVKRS